MRLRPTDSVTVPDSSRKPAEAQGSIDATDRVRPELFGQSTVRRVVFGYDQQSAGVPVDAMHDAGTQDTADTGQAPAATVQEGV